MVMLYVVVGFRVCQKNSSAGQRKILRRKEVMQWSGGYFDADALGDDEVAEKAAKAGVPEILKG
jgi:hypothetical protein